MGGIEIELGYIRFSWIICVLCALEHWWCELEMVTFLVSGTVYNWDVSDYNRNVSD